MVNEQKQAAKAHVKIRHHLVSTFVNIQTMLCFVFQWSAPPASLLYATLALGGFMDFIFQLSSLWL